MGSITVPADDPSFLYSPYNWTVGTLSGIGYAITLNGGSRLRFRFDAVNLSALTLDFYTAQASANPPGQIPSFAIRVDDGPWQIAQARATAITCTLPPWSASWPSHAVEMRVRSIPTAVPRWTPYSASLPVPPAACIFTGYTATASSFATGAIPVARARNVLVFGDSQGEGWLNVANAGGRVDATGGTDGMDTTASWSFRLGDELGAEIAVVGNSGLGFINLPSYGTPSWVSSWNALWQGAPRVLTPTPDLVVCMLGGDDFLGYITGNTACSPAAVQAAYTTLLQDMFAAMPMLAPVRVACLTPMPGNANAQTTPAVIAAFKAAVRGAAASVPGVAYVDTTNWFGPNDASFDGAHPLATVHVDAIAPLAGTALRPQFMSPTLIPSRS